MSNKLAGAYGGHAELSDDLYDTIGVNQQGEKVSGVYVHDQTTALVDRFLTKELGSFSVTADTVVDNFTFEAVAGHGFVVGNIANFMEEQNYSQFEVLAVAGDTITLDTAMDSVYTSDGTHNRATRSMLVDGSSAIQTFSLRPIAGMMWDIVRLFMTIESASAMDFSTFGSMAAITRGCVFRLDNGVQRNVFNYKTNGDMINRCHDHNFVQKTGGGLHGFSARTTFAGQDKRGVAVRLVGDDGDELQHIIQDDLTTGNTKFNIIAQGHVCLV